MSLDPIRHLAWEILSSVAKGNALEPELDAAMSRLDEPRDRRFLAELVRGSIQWRGRYDHIVNALSRRKGGTGHAVRRVLRLGLHQLLVCDRVPAYAAVDQSVNLARRVAGRKTVPYVNGLLQNVARRLASDSVTGLDDLFPNPDTDPAGHLAAWESYPLWLTARWVERFGYEAARSLCRFNNARPPLALRVLEAESRDTVAARLETRGLAVEPGRLTRRSLIAATRPPRSDLSFLLAEEPALIVQDEAVQAATEFLSEGIDGCVLDLCAAPGGKTAHLLAGLPAGSTVVAMDRDPSRLRLIADTAQRTDRYPRGILAADGEQAPFVDGTFDAVLLDGPCSGTGVLRRHPEGRWRLRPETLTENAKRLLDLARAAHRLVKPGGFLLYATCSLEPEENEGVVDSLLSEYPDLVPCASPGGDPEGWRRYWLPHRDGADGFFAARLRREESA